MTRDGLCTVSTVHSTLVTSNQCPVVTVITRPEPETQTLETETLETLSEGERGGGQSDGYQPGDPPLHPVLGLPRVLGRPLDCAHHGHHIRVSDILFSNAVLGVVTSVSDNNNQTSEPGKAETEQLQTETFALVTFYLHHFREGSGPLCALCGVT